MFNSRILSLERVLLIVAVSTVLFANVSSAQVTFSVFTDPHPVVSGGTVGFAFAGDKFIGTTEGDGQGILYSTDLLGNNVQIFAPMVNIPASAASKHAVASSVGLGQFPMRDVYVAAGNGVMHISHDGTESKMLVTGLLSDVIELRFDVVGTFGYQLLLSTLDGQIYRVNSAGIPTLLASIGEPAEGLDVVPLHAKFASFDGQIIVTGEQSGLLRAIDWSGNLTVLNSSDPIPNAASINFVPLNLGSTGTSIEGFYQAHYPANVVKSEGSQFSGLSGDAIVGGEWSPLWRVHWNGKGFAITVLAPNPGQVEDGIFVTPNLIDPPFNSCTLGTGDDDKEDANLIIHAGTCRHP